MVRKRDIKFLPSRELGDVPFPRGTPSRGNHELLILHSKYASIAMSTIGSEDMALS